MSNDFEGNQKMFREKVQRGRRGEHTMENLIKDANGQLLRDGKM